MTDRLAELGALQYAVENLSTAGTNPNRLGLAGYIHAAYTDYQAWAAANPGVNPNRLSARGRLYGYFHDYGYSPLNLFSSGEVGAWYDPSDLSTMFQDREGTTPVTADGQTVGLILDKSKGLALGPELVTNGDFSNGTTGWSFDPQWTVVEGRATHDGSFASNIFQAAVVANKWYKCEFDLYGTGYVEVRIGDASSVLASYANSPGHKIVYVYSNGNYVYFRSTIGPGVQLDNISVKELSGNHAVAPSDAARPLYKTDGTYHWLQFDGVDDSLSTAAIDFTGTDKMSVFGGIKNNRNSSIQGFITLGPPGTEGNFLNWIPSISGQNNYEIGQFSGTNSYARWTAPTPPYTVVITEQLDLAQSNINNRCKWRENGTQLTQIAGYTAGASGVFKNDVLTIAGIGGGSLYSGNTYSIIVRGALSTAQEVTDTETWVNQRTGAY